MFDEKPPIGPAQERVLSFIRDTISRDGVAPSVREIGEGLGLRSTSTIHYHLTILAEHGLIQWEKGKNRSIRLAADPGIPIMGRIAAGVPIEAIEQGSEFWDLGKSWVDSDVFMLQVKGTSMIEDCIADGDLVVVKRQSSADNGDIVVALLESGEATLKRIYREKGRIRLQPANSEMEPIYVERVAVQGKVIGVVRQVR